MFEDRSKAMSVLTSFSLRLTLSAGVLALPIAASAQTVPAAPKPYVGPLDTIMSTRLWTDVPPAQDFVKETRPDAKSLEYAPLTGKDPERPAPRDAAGIAALQAELESGGAANERRAQGLRDPVAPATKPGVRHARKAASKKAASVSAAR